MFDRTAEALGDGYGNDGLRDDASGQARTHAFADDRARFHIERGEQRRRAVAFVVVGAPLDLTGPHVC